ncbi:MAG: nucleotide modification associated domain-containing protein [Archaeoglobaceae archaeon]
MKEKNQMINHLDQTVNEIREFLAKKMQSYRNSYFETRKEYGSLVFLIRLIDKVNRLKALIDEDMQEFFKESYEDTIKDIIGYCLLELIFEKIQKKEG